MTKMIKMSLIALSFAAAAPFAMAADNGGMNGRNKDMSDRSPASLEQRELWLDRESTGSIQQSCDTGAYDANGNCVYAAPNMQ
jgi:hypothetical protein